mgnify:FL=1
MAEAKSKSQPIEKILFPFQKFIEAEASSGVLLLLCSVIALAWANSPWSDSYAGLWHTTLTISLGSFALAKPLHFWINEGLMSVFFFVVGLEIKREILVGELNTPKKAALPIAAALGGMLLPAGIYIALNIGKIGAAGWGVPMATDIAFALGVLALLGDRIPVALKIFLTALAIVDDMGAVLVIVLFYTTEISWLALAVGAGFMISLVIANLAGTRNPLIYALLGGFVWLAFLESGIHATIAGVLAAMAIPARARLNTDDFLGRSRALLGEIEHAGTSGEYEPLKEEQRAAIQALESAIEHVEMPLERLERVMHPWVTFAILPLFALANAGVALGSGFTEALTSLVSLGIIAGLVIGKQIGITFFAWLAVRFGIAALPERVNWLQIYGVGWLGGIGFTMSIFIAGLAFGDTPLLSEAKIGIITASLIAGIAGLIFLKKISPLPLDTHWLGRGYLPSEQGER